MIQRCTQTVQQGAMQSSVTQFNPAFKLCDKEQRRYLSHDSTLHSSCATSNNACICHMIQLCTQAVRQATVQISVTWFNSALKLCNKQQCRYLSHDSTLHSSCETSNNAGICHMIQLCTQAVRQETKQVSVTWFNSALKLRDKEQRGQCRYLSHTSTLHSNCATRNNAGMCHTLQLCTQTVQQGTMQAFVTQFIWHSSHATRLNLVSVTQFNSALKPCDKEQWGYQSHNSPLHSNSPTLQLSTSTPLHSPAISEETRDSTTKILF